MKPVKIPRRIDDPIHVLLWSVDEVAPIFIALFFGVLMGKAHYFLPIGFIAAHVYRRFREGNPDGFMYHAIYWAGLTPQLCRSFRNPFVRRYFP